MYRDPEWFTKHLIQQFARGVYKYLQSRKMTYDLIRHDILPHTSVQLSSMIQSAPITLYTIPESPTLDQGTIKPDPHAVQISSISTPTIHAPHSTSSSPLNSPEGPLYKQTILKNLHKRNLREYLGNPSELLLEQFGKGPVGAGEVLKKGDEDIYSSDDEVESPLVGRVAAMRAPPTHVVRGEEKEVAKGTAVVRMDKSGETVVEEGLSPREKVSGFISWDALKRDDQLHATQEGERVEDKEEKEEIERKESHESGVSWEQEALGAAI